MQVRDIAFTIADVIATHNLVDYIKPGEDKERILSGALLGAIGYGLGPKIEEQVTSINSGVFDMQIAREDLLYTLGGTVLGGLLGYVAGEEYYPRNEDSLSSRIRQFVRDDGDPKRPGGLITVASAGYLGYSLLAADHSEEFIQRQRWGLGAGALGYLMGPEAIRKFKDLLVPQDQAEQGIEVYRRGGAVFGAAIGTGLGYWFARTRRGHNE